MHCKCIEVRLLFFSPNCDTESVYVFAPTFILPRTHFVYFSFKIFKPFGTFGNLADLAQILQEAKERWLRPAEICEILRNFQNFELTADPPVRPPGCSWHIFLNYYILFICA